MAVTPDVICIAFITSQILQMIYSCSYYQLDRNTKTYSTSFQNCAQFLSLGMLNVLLLRLVFPLIVFDVISKVACRFLFNQKKILVQA